MSGKGDGVRRRERRLFGVDNITFVSIGASRHVVGQSINLP